MECEPDPFGCPAHARADALLRKMQPHLPELPVTTVLPELAAALARHGSAVLVAPPGAGKTTTVPVALLDAPWLAGQRIVLLAPRRLAARAAAARMAALLNQTVGETVGYRIRMDSRTGPGTRIVVMTEGVLTRMVQTDPALEGVGLVIFDEFHERSLEADLGLALCREIQGVLNEELRLLVMSATLDPAPVTALLHDAPLVACAGRLFPVATRYVPPPRSQPLERAVADRVLRTVAAGEGSVLVFLPGAPEIRRVARLLAAGGLPADWSVAPLYGNLSRTAQDTAIAPPPAGRHKIVLATAIAETSLTIEGIAVVVDGGLQRVPRFDARSGMTRLVTVPVSQAAADQRRGRAGRLGPGICYRMWSQAAHAGLPARNRPEILNTDLAALALELAWWGEADAGALAWLDPPPQGPLQQARTLLTELGALDENGRITAHGRRLAQLPLHPRLAHMVVAAGQAGMGGTACDMAAILSERDPLRAGGAHKDTDLRRRLELLHAFRSRATLPRTDERTDWTAVRRIVKVAALLRQRLHLSANDRGVMEPGRLLAWAYPDRIAGRRPGSVDRYVMTSGLGAFFDTPDPLGGHDYLVIAHLDGERREARIYLAAAYDRDTLMHQWTHRLKWQETVTWDDQRQCVSAERRLTLGALVLRREPQTDPDPQAVADTLTAAIRARGIEVLPWTPARRTFQTRTLLLRRMATETESDAPPWPDLSDAGLMAALDTWLAPWLTGIAGFKALACLDLTGALRSRLSRQQLQQLDTWAPTHITVPSGRRHPIDYNNDPPALAVRLQEMFGTDRTPAIAGGRLPLQLHLLSPAGRPAQITQDLAGFWRNSYGQVKKALKGRYPKHFWPDDPLASAPTAQAKPRGGKR
ncbi:ATP-dependent helicase HrpB [Desulfatitalea alkaliphila]|uniref:ATP-dependent helicase HrpB n=1 Tax=Desulfatitalea alkaliphila TaxID=2929485 RepID=A0AA41QYP8_9BACT|nr:ATP-dependent helicase HrpB [Desulfatitalea alkaliphila]MCJ8499472.1 ATP-dependent helicase HrpB [Desulfatitalea alkaliphila]